MSEKEAIPLFQGDTSEADSAELQWAFPEVNPGIKPLGGRIIIQLRRIKKTVGRIVLVEETKENEKWNNMVGKVIAVGPLAYKNRDTMESWPEGTWAMAGDYVRVPRWGGDRWERMVSNEENSDINPVLFMTTNDHEVIGLITDNPLSFKAYV